MQSTVTFLLTFAASFLLVLGLAWFTPWTTQAPTRHGGTASTQTDGPGIGTSGAPPPCVVDPKVADMEIADLERRTQELQQLLDYIEGPPLEPPAPMPSEAELARWIEEKLAHDPAYGGWLEWISCDEYPCQALLSFENDLDPGVTSSLYRRHFMKGESTTPLSNPISVNFYTSASRDGTRQEVHVLIFAERPTADVMAWSKVKRRRRVWEMHQDRTRRSTDMP